MVLKMHYVVDGSENALHKNQARFLKRPQIIFSKEAAENFSYLSVPVPPGPQSSS